jgi:hypothetical protein
VLTFVERAFPYSVFPTGYGGTAHGDCITRPYHAWEWSRDGSLVDVPYSTRTPKATVRTWPTREVEPCLENGRLRRCRCA